MKSNTKKRLIAFMLCMVLVLSSTISAFADDLDTQTQDQTTTMDEPTTGTQETAENKAQTEQPAAETPAQNTQEAAPQTNDSHSEAAEQPTVSSEENNASNETIECEATQLKQEVDNENDTKTTVVADIPAGAFHAHASEITMEVKRLSTEDVNDAVIVKLIKNALTTNTSLSNYVLYDVVFKVNGVETEPLKSIDVNFKGSGLKVKDTKKATAFYFAPAKSEDGIEEDLLVELPQREDKIKELLDAGTDKTMEQIEDEFDFSELSVKDEVADELKMEVRKNQVYGCYVVEDKITQPESNDVANEAGNTASGNPTVGNFLDNVFFTRDKLTPVEGTANVTLTKTISGLEYATAYTLARTLKFTIGNKTISGTDLNWVWSNDGKTYTGSIVLSLKERECGTNLKVEETSTGSLDVTGYTRASSVQIDNGSTTSSTSGTLSISTGETKTVAFTNAYVANGGSGDEPESTLSHEKYIKRNDDGTYNITLNASGTVGTKTHKKNVDIVLIVDTSGSMDKSDSNNSVTKLVSTKNAIKALIDAFNAKSDTVDTRYKLVTFNTSATTNTGSWTDGNTLYDDYIKNLKADGGTNYDKGLSYGGTAITNGSRTDAKKIVIFLTDGQPTYYGDGPSNCGSHTSEATLNAAQTSASTIICSEFYAVGIGLPSSVSIYSQTGSDIWNGNSWFGSWQHPGDVKKTMTGQALLQSISDCTNAASKEAINLTDSSKLTEKFREIVGQTLTAACTNVTITDQLSQYVAVTDASKLQVKIASKDNNQYTNVYTKDFDLNNTGKVTLNNKEIATVTYDSSKKEAKLKFNDDYSLEANYYYYLTITNVTPNQKAFDEYKKNDGYGTTKGEANTDEDTGGYTSKNKGTSSGQAGFYSNATATVSYKNKKSSGLITENYQKPVIQVQSISVRKDWKDATPPENTTVLAQLVDENGKSVNGKILELNSSNNWTGSFEFVKLDKYDRYSFKELKEDQNGNITYNNKKYSMVDENSIIEINDTNYKVTYSNDDDIHVITNTKYSQPIKIIKQNNSGVTLKGAEFTLTDSNNKSTKYTSDKDGIIFEGELNYGTYTLRETKAPSGYSKLVDSITITVTKDGIQISENNKVQLNQTNGIYELIIKNDMLYSLPSTGGSGIYLYMIGGILLMFAAAWILYKNKCREVLER